VGNRVEYISFFLEPKQKLIQWMWVRRIFFAGKQAQGQWEKHSHQTKDFPDFPGKIHFRCKSFRKKVA
jgi:hypothetical protein